jgi:L-tryptophan---pyruvate aminotransferase
MAPFLLLSMLGLGVAMTTALRAGTVGNAISPNKDWCSYHGVFQPDVESCLCWSCWTGPNCSSWSPCSIDATVADGGIFTEYWEDENPEALQLTIPIWYRNEYMAPFAIPPYTTPFNLKLQESVFDLHRVVGNANTTDRVLIFGDGSTEVIRAILYALAKNAGRPFMIYARPPYYPAFRNWANQNPSIGNFTNRTDLDPADVVEILTYPNNPDGMQYPPVYPTAHALIHDLVYYWPHTCPNVTMRSDDIMVFSSSKLTGHAQDRVGWALLTDNNLAYSTMGFFSTDSFGLSITSAWRQQRVLAYIAATASDSNGFLLSTQRVLQGRWPLLRSIFDSQATPLAFELQSLPDTWFGWVQCNRVVPGKDCVGQFAAYNISGEFRACDSGICGHARLNLNLREDEWVELAQRLAEMMTGAPPRASTEY